MPITTKLGAMVTFFSFVGTKSRPVANMGLLRIKSHGHIVTSSCRYISTTTMLLVTKLSRLGIYNEEHPSIKSQGPLITWSYKVT